jgi:hypothetical protein
MTNLPVSENSAAATASERKKHMIKANNFILVKILFISAFPDFALTI